MEDKTLTFRHRSSDIAPDLPKWVPSAIKFYLAHTEQGVPIRAIARSAGCHASTILRQVRRIETKRDDPLVDSALRSLGRQHDLLGTPAQHTTKKETEKMSFQDNATQVRSQLLDDLQSSVEAARVLRRLCESGSVMALAADMEKAVIVRDTVGGVASRTGVVDRDIAEAMALKDWIASTQSGKITRYTITAAGRTALEEFLQDTPVLSKNGFEESQAPFALGNVSGSDPVSTSQDTQKRRNTRYNFAESPLLALARRKDKNGEFFLSADLVSAGEQLREDFELAQMGLRVTQNWDNYINCSGRGTFVPDSGVPDGPANARKRVADALEELGPGLSDVVLRCCCYLEALETTEKKLGWSARSGKIVLRIALIRLKRHYDETIGPGGPLIG